MVRAGKGMGLATICSSIPRSAPLESERSFRRRQWNRTHGGGFCRTRRPPSNPRAPRSPPTFTN